MTIGKKVLGIVISLIVVYVGLRIIGAGCGHSQGASYPISCSDGRRSWLVLFFALVRCCLPDTRALVE